MSKCCRPHPPCLHFCRLDGRLIAGQGIISNPENGWEYEVIKVLAVGGMGTTYLVYSYQHQKLAVLKEINNELARKAKVREMFQREARVLSSFDRPDIPKYYDFFATNDYYSLVMELIHGQNLEEIPTPNVVQVIDWAISVAQILSYLHQCDPPVIHRDIKPGNLILRYHPRKIVLIDFGAVKEVTTPPGTRIATPGYGAPEQSKGQPCIQSDFYALGTTLIALLTRRNPSDFYNHQQQKFIDLQTAGIPGTLLEIIDLLTAFNPDDRPKKASEIETLLNNLIN